MRPRRLVVPLTQEWLPCWAFERTQGRRPAEAVLRRTAMQVQAGWRAGGARVWVVWVVWVAWSDVATGLVNVMNTTFVAVTLYARCWVECLRCWVESDQPC